MKVKRCKSKEHTWIFKGSFRVTAYKIISADGNTYIVKYMGERDVKGLLVPDEKEEA